MKTMRRILGDRISATAIAALVACLLALQGFMGGIAQSAAAMSAVDPLHVICSSSGETVADLPAGGDKPAGKAAECPCGMPCRLATMAMPAIVGDSGVFIHPFAETVAAVFPRFDDVFLPVRQGLLPEARAPPFLS